MSDEFRPSTPADAPALTRLLAGAFDSRPDSSLLEPAMMHWKYWAPRGDFDAPRSYVIARDGVVRAHAGLWPVRLDGEGQPIVGVQMIDWAASKDVPGIGLSVVMRLTRMFDFMYSIGGADATQKLLPAYGFRAVTRVWTAARPLRPFAQILTHQQRDVKLLPRLVRNWMWSRGVSANADRDWTAAEVAPADVAPASGIPRPAAFFEYLNGCPRVRFRLFEIRQSGQARGHFTIAVTRGQAKVGGVWLRTPDDAGYRAVYQLVQRTARALPGVNEIVVRGSVGRSAQGATAAGLRILGESPVVLLNKTRRFELPDEIQFQLVDDDSAFMDFGVTSYLT